MAVLNLLYRSINMSSYEDNYGGNVFDNYYYSYLRLQDNIIYIFSSCPMYSASKLKPIQLFDDSKTIKNIDLILKNSSHAEYKKIGENELKFSLPFQVQGEHGEIIEVTRNYTAIFENEWALLKLKAFDENNPNKIVVDAEFKRLDL